MNKGIFIPEHIIRLNDISGQEKTLLATISYLCNSQGCFASNAYFGKILGVTAKTASTIVQKLIKKNYISSSIDKLHGNRRFLLVNTPIIHAQPIPENKDSILYNRHSYPENKGEAIPENGGHNKELKNN